MPGQTRKRKMSRDGFSFYSVQEHRHIVNGKGKTLIKEVNIKNGRGKKTVIVRNEKGKTRKSTIPIKTDELDKIRRNIFIPGLFRECLDNCNK